MGAFLCKVLQLERRVDGRWCVPSSSVNNEALYALYLELCGRFCTLEQQRLTGSDDWELQFGAAFGSSSNLSGSPFRRGSSDSGGSNQTPVSAPKIPAELALLFDAPLARLLKFESALRVEHFAGCIDDCTDTDRRMLLQSLLEGVVELDEDRYAMRSHDTNVLNDLANDVNHAPVQEHIPLYEVADGPNGSSAAVLTLRSLMTHLSMLTFVAYERRVFVLHQPEHVQVGSESAAALDRALSSSRQRGIRHFLSFDDSTTLLPPSIGAQAAFRLVTDELRRIMDGLLVHAPSDVATSEDALTKAIRMMVAGEVKPPRRPQALPSTTSPQRKPLTVETSSEPPALDLDDDGKELTPRPSWAQSEKKTEAASGEAGLALAVKLLDTTGYEAFRQLLAQPFKGHKGNSASNPAANRRKSALTQHFQRHKGFRGQLRSKRSLRTADDATPEAAALDLDADSPEATMVLDHVFEDVEVRAQMEGAAPSEIVKALKEQSRGKPAFGRGESFGPGGNPPPRRHGSTKLVRRARGSSESVTATDDDSTSDELLEDSMELQPVSSGITPSPSMSGRTGGNKFGRRSRKTKQQKLHEKMKARLLADLNRVTDNHDDDAHDLYIDAVAQAEEFAADRIRQRRRAERELECESDEDEKHMTHFAQVELPTSAPPIASTTTEVDPSVLTPERRHSRRSTVVGSSIAPALSPSQQRTPLIALAESQRGKKMLYEALETHQSLRTAFLLVLEALMPPLVVAAAVEVVSPAAAAPNAADDSVETPVPHAQAGPVPLTMTEIEGIEAALHQTAGPLVAHITHRLRPDGTASLTVAGRLRFLNVEMSAFSDVDSVSLTMTVLRDRSCTVEVSLPVPIPRRDLGTTTTHWKQDSEPTGSAPGGTDPTSPPPRPVERGDPTQLTYDSPEAVFLELWVPNDRGARAMKEFRRAQGATPVSRSVSPATTPGQSPSTTPAADMPLGLSPAVTPQLDEGAGSPTPTVDIGPQLTRQVLNATDGQASVVSTSPSDMTEAGDRDDKFEPTPQEEWERRRRTMHAALENEKANAKREAEARKLEVHLLRRHVRNATAASGSPGNKTGSPRQGQQFGHPSNAYASGVFDSPSGSPGLTEAQREAATDASVEQYEKTTDEAKLKAFSSTMWMPSSVATVWDERVQVARSAAATPVKDSKFVPQKLDSRKPVAEAVTKAMSTKVQPKRPYSARPKKYTRSTAGVSRGAADGAETPVSPRNRRGGDVDMMEISAYFAEGNAAADAAAREAEAAAREAEAMLTIPVGPGNGLGDLLLHSDASLRLGSRDFSASDSDAFMRLALMHDTFKADLVDGSGSNEDDVKHATDLDDEDLRLAGLIARTNTGRVLVKDSWIEAIRPPLNNTRALFALTSLLDIDLQEASTRRRVLKAGAVPLLVQLLIISSKSHSQVLALKAARVLLRVADSPEIAAAMHSARALAVLYSELTAILDPAEVVASPVIFQYLTVCSLLLAALVITPGPLQSVIVNPSFPHGDAAQHWVNLLSRLMAGPLATAGSESTAGFIKIPVPHRDRLVAACGIAFHAMSLVRYGPTNNAAPPRPRVIPGAVACTAKSALAMVEAAIKSTTPLAESTKQSLSIVLLHVAYELHGFEERTDPRIAGGGVSNGAADVANVVGTTAASSPYHHRRSTGSLPKHPPKEAFWPLCDAIVPLLALFVPRQSARKSIVPTELSSEFSLNAFEGSMRGAARRRISVKPPLPRRNSGTDSGNASPAMSPRASVALMSPPPGALGRSYTSFRASPRTNSFNTSSAPPGLKDSDKSIRSGRLLLATVFATRQVLAVHSAPGAISASRIKEDLSSHHQGGPIPSHLSNAVPTATSLLFPAGSGNLLPRLTAIVIATIQNVVSVPPATEMAGLPPTPKLPPPFTPLTHEIYLNDDFSSTDSEEDQYDGTARLANTHRSMHSGLRSPSQGSFSATARTAYSSAGGDIDTSNPYEALNAFSPTLVLLHETLAAIRTAVVADREEAVPQLLPVLEVFLRLLSLDAQLFPVRPGKADMGPLAEARCACSPLSRLVSGIRIHAAGIVHLIATFPHALGIIEQDDGFPLLLGCLDTTAVTELGVECAGAVAELSRHKPMLGNEPLLATLRSLLSRHSPALRCEAVTAFANMIATPESAESVSQLLCGMFDTFASFLADPNPPLVAATARLLSLMATVPSQLRVIAELSITNSVLDAMQRHDGDPVLMRQCLGCLAALSEQPEALAVIVSREAVYDLLKARLVAATTEARPGGSNGRGGNKSTDGPASSSSGVAARYQGQRSATPGRMFRASGGAAIPAPSSASSSAQEQRIVLLCIAAVTKTAVACDALLDRGVVPLLLSLLGSEDDRVQDLATVCIVTLRMHGKGGAAASANPFVGDELDHVKTVWMRDPKPMPLDGSHKRKAKRPTPADMKAAMTGQLSATAAADMLLQLNREV